jgi:ubiquitin-activating enzyme E1 C
MAGKWVDIDKITGREGPFANEAFTPNAEKAKKFLTHDCKVLVIGAGGLGCELLKNLALTGFKNIHVIDMDTIDYSDLNRQFLFRKSDVGKSKAEVAAKFINDRVPGVKVVPHFCSIQEKDDDFYRGFNLVIAGLDSIAARRWLNAKLLSLVELDDEGNPDPDTIIPMIDGGTEGFKGQARIILPRVNACFECSLDTFPPQTGFPLCTLASIPRQPEHCIEWAHILEWPKVFPDKKFDADDPEHMKWRFETSVKRAKEFNIEGVTYRLTQGVVKNIIPAIASTNAIIAAAEANEAFKFATDTGPNVNNWMSYNGVESVYTYTFEYERKSECAVCCATKLHIDVKKSTTLEQFIEQLTQDTRLQVKKPNISSPSKTLINNAPHLYESTKKNLARLMGDLVDEGDELSIMESGITILLTVRFVD